MRERSTDAAVIQIAITDAIRIAERKGFNVTVTALLQAKIECDREDQGRAEIAKESAA